ncbi:relaxase/mobilization nuclease domain-containing protein [Sphingomonas sp. IC081]|uniref:relaxase/mobilization nuclease domain-containing protein n=1 Tax=Sphingomonas sp. IC081 TaxID=304378 RepID=UPI00115BB4A8|nr:relaxase/mobilization nuclease domain-containing protein [Sphingomonas sp. IC081]QDK36045.1 hypothetical protein DM450_25380 [Sphingomonas sp. IC081]
MIIKGGSVGNAKWWGNHLLSEKNDRAEVKDMRGVLSEDLRKALYEMRGVAEGSRCGANFLYQANINPERGEELSEAQWAQAFDVLERNLGLEGHARVIVEHEKEGRVHRHCIWNRVDSETMLTANMWGNYETHAATARELEQSFDLSPTPSPSREADRLRSPEQWEYEAEQRSGISRAAVREEFTELWYEAENGQAFKAAIEERGYILARGDRRDFCVIDQAGDYHSLARRLDGVRAAEVRAFMGDVDRESLPSVTEAQAMQRERIEQGQEQVAAHDRTQAEYPGMSGAYDSRVTEAHNLRDDFRAARVEAEQPQRDAHDTDSDTDAGGQGQDAGADGVRDGLAVVDAAANTFAKLGDFIADLLSFGATETKPDPAQEIIARRRAAAALSSIRDDIEHDRPLNAEDVRNLSPATLANIQAKGDAWLVMLAEQHQREEEERRRGGLER